MKKMIFGLLAIIMVFVSCKKDDLKQDEKPLERVKLGETVTSNNEKIILWSDAILTTGYHKLYLSVTDAGNKNVANAVVSFQPLMDMGTMKHSSPVEQPVYNAVSALYEGSAVFTMPSGMNSWMVNVTVNGEVKTINVTIPEAKTKIVGSYAGLDGNKYVVALVPSKNWQVGMNDLEIQVSQNLMMTFPAVNDLKISLSPEMPSMGHGSPNNINPVNIGNGRYKGKVNFTMTGDWTLHFKISKNDVVVVEDATIDILF